MGVLNGHIHECIMPMRGRDLVVMTTGGRCGQEGGTQEQLCSIVMKFTVKANRTLVFGF